MAGSKISSEAFLAIEHIMNGLTTATTKPDKVKEVEAIREVCQKGEMTNVKLTKVDVKIVTNEKLIYLVDIKTAKPKCGRFQRI